MLIPRNPGESGIAGVMDRESQEIPALTSGDRRPLGSGDLLPIETYETSPGTDRGLVA